VIHHFLHLLHLFICGLHHGNRVLILVTHNGRATPAGLVMTKASDKDTMAFQVGIGCVADILTLYKLSCLDIIIIIIII